LTVLHFKQGAVREYDVIAVAGVVVGELPVTLVAQPVGLADRDFSAGLTVEPLIDRLGDGPETRGTCATLNLASLKSQAYPSGHGTARSLPLLRKLQPW